MKARGESYYRSFARAPLFWAALLFCMGIAVGTCFNSPLPLILGTVFCFFSALLGWVLARRKNLSWLGHLSFILLCAALAGAGALYYRLWLPQTEQSLSAAMAGKKPLRLKLKVKKTSEFRQNYSRVLCDMLWLDQGFGPEKASARLWLNYPGQEIFFPGQQIMAWAHLRKIRGFKNPLVPDPALRLARSGIYFSASQVPEMPVFPINRSRNFLLPALYQYREQVKSELDRSGAASSYLLAAMLLGEKDAIPQEVWDLFRATNSSHLLVISGFNLSMVAAFSFFIILGFFRLQPWLLQRTDPYPLAGLITAVPVSFYAIITGLEIPTFRALLMVMVLLLAIAFRKTRELLNTLGLAALIILLLNPSSQFDASFQLSFLAVFVLILYFPASWKLFGGEKLGTEKNLARLEKGPFIPILRRLWIKLFIYFYALFLSTILIQIFLAPLNAYYFSQFSFAGPFCNILLVPICGFWVYPVGLVGLWFCEIWPGLADQLFILAGWGAWLMEKIAGAFASLPHCNFLVRPPTALELWGWFLALLALLESLRISASAKTFRAGIFLRLLWPAALMLAGVILLASGYHQVLKTRTRPDSARLSVIDVGMGQSILIELPGPKRILIDGGGRLGAINLGSAVVGRFLLERGVSRLDKVILTHPETDHAAGLEYILQNFQVEEFLLPEKFNKQSLFLVDIAKRRKVPVSFINSSRPPMEIAGASLQFLNPSPALPKNVSLNDSSAVVKISAPSFSALLPGDISAKVERQLVRLYGEKLQSQILVAAHHGSNTSSSDEFLQAVSPKCIIISGGENQSLVLPAPEALARMQKLTSCILRTDQLGEIEFNFSAP